MASEVSGFEMPYIENSYVGSAKETGEEASRTQVDKKRTSPSKRLKAKWKDARKSLKAMHLFPKRARNNRRTKQLIDQNQESIEVIDDPEVSKQALATGVASFPPKKTKHDYNKETSKTINDSSFWDQGKSASFDSSTAPSSASDETKDLKLMATLAILLSREHSLLTCSDESTKPQVEDDIYKTNHMDFLFTSNVLESSPRPTVGNNPAASTFTRVQSAQAGPVEQGRNGLELNKLDIDALINEQDNKAMLEDEDVDDLINTIFDEFDMVDRFEQEIESGCAGIDLQNTTERMFIRWANKVDTTNACGCGVDDTDDDQEGIDESVSSSEKKAFSGDDNTPTNLEEGFEDGTSENLTGSSSGPDPSNDSELNSSSIDDDESIVAAGVFDEEETCDTFSFDNDSLATEYDDFKKAMQLLKNRAAKKGISEARLFEKIRNEQQRRESLLQPS